MERLASEYIKVGIGTTAEEKQGSINRNYGKMAIVTSAGMGIFVGVLTERESHSNQAYYVVDGKHRTDLSYCNLRELLIEP
ncbi:hypothetical protein HYW74_01440 [Candidatus Pacearchaeota archaeon]|nr:hypothetical protein [Candidatus Pacearchaeota archaeon]